MAIFYKNIKGTTNAPDNDNGLWTWIKWSEDLDSSVNDLKQSKAPSIYINKGNTETNWQSLGHIITSNTNAQFINKNICTKSWLILKDSIFWAPNGGKYPTIHAWADSAINDNGIGLRIHVGPYTAHPGLHDFFPDIIEQPDPNNLKNDSAYDEHNKKIYSIYIFKEDKDKQQHYINLAVGGGTGVPGETAITTSGRIEATKGIRSTSGEIEGVTLWADSYLHAEEYIATDGYIEANSYVKARYFNATSDIRAKENLSPLSTNALDIIKKVQVYTFNYKNNPKERTIGVIAQEFLDKKLDDVSLVANEGASGENGDYMSIKETKLIYLLLKGMQEQQTEIDDLKEQIKKLESK